MTAAFTRGSMPEPAVARVWRGRTREADTERYAEYHHEHVVRQRGATPGNLGVQVLRQVRGGVAEFTTNSSWSPRDEVRAYAGSEIEQPRHLPRDAELLLELRTRVEHFEVLLREWSGRAR